MALVLPPWQDFPHPDSFASAAKMNLYNTALQQLDTGVTDLNNKIAEILVLPTATSGSVVQNLITGLTATGGTIVLAPGSHTWDIVPAFPRNLANKITVRGLPGHRIELTGPGRTFDVSKIADHDVFKNIELCDLLVDNNGIVGVARHVLFGNKPSAVTTGRINFEDITIRRCTVLGLVTDKDSVATHWAVLISPTQAAAGEGTQTYAKRILVEDVDVFDGNAAVNIIGSITGAAVAGYNLYLDDIKIYRCRHFQSAIVGRGALDGTAIWGASFQIGSRAYGGTARVRDCYSYGIGDVAYEMNSMRDMVIENCVAEEAAGFAFYHTNYNYPDKIVAGPPATPSPEQKITWRNCKFRRQASEVYGAPFASNENLVIPLGTVVFENCSVYHNKSAYTDWIIPAGDFLSVNAAFAEIHIDGFKAVLEGVNYNQAGADSASMMSFVCLTPGDNHVSIHRTKITVTGDAPGAGLVGITGFNFSGASNYTIDADEIDWNLNVTNNVNSGGTIFNFVGTMLRGRISRLRVLNNTDNRGIQVRGTTLLTIVDELTVENCDFTNMTAGQNELQFFVDGTSNADKVRPINNKWRTYNQSRQPVAASATLDILPDLVGVTSTAAARTLTLPLASDYPPGRILRIKDESGAAATNNITVARAGADTIDGAVSVVINTNFGSTKLYSTGAAWTISP